MVNITSVKSKKTRIQKCRRSTSQGRCKVKHTDNTEDEQSLKQRPSN